MFPEYISLVLQDLGYLSLIIIAPCTMYNTINNLRFGEKLQSHIDIDLVKFAQIQTSIGEHKSMINDLRADKASGLATTLEALLRRQ